MQNTQEINKSFTVGQVVSGHASYSSIYRLCALFGRYYPEIGIVESSHVSKRIAGSKAMDSATVDLIIKDVDAEKSDAEKSAILHILWDNHNKELTPLAPTADEKAYINTLKADSSKKIDVYRHKYSEKVDKFFQSKKAEIQDLDVKLFENVTFLQFYEDCQDKDLTKRECKIWAGLYLDRLSSVYAPASVSTADKVAMIRGENEGLKEEIAKRDSAIAELMKRLDALEKK